MRYLFILLISSAALWGCSSGPAAFFEVPVELRSPDKKNEFISKYSAYFAGKTFFIDPGHGGEDRRSVGFAGLVVEADINLYVSLALRDYLKTAGAKVILSREIDKTVPLKERSEMANKSGADFFISIHHNAPGSSADNWTNYTSTYYHALETDYEYEPGERDLAKYIQRDLAYAMRNSGGLGSFDGTYSDYFIYPKAGFSVLRLTEIPAVLVECGFFTNEYEEQRLSSAEFNRIQAWGIFRGIARYLAAGVPHIKLLNEKNIFTGKEAEIFFSLKDSVGIDPSTIKVYFDSVAVDDFIYDKNSDVVNVKINNISEGSHYVRLIAANRNGIHTLPFQREIIVKHSN